MKKRVLSMLMVMIMMVSMLSVSVFAAHTEPCSYASNWSNNETHHWKDCELADCDVANTALPNYGEHAWGGDSVCDTCSYTCTHGWLSDETEAICKFCGVKHNHTANLEWVKTDPVNHWQVCKDCPVNPNEQYNKAEHNLVVNGAVKECSACGYSEHNHSWKSEWVKDDPSAHWHECENTGCTVTDNTAKDGYAAHTMVQNGTVNACSVCGYSKNVCVWEENPVWDGSQHWYKCIDSTCDKTTGEGNHYDHNGNGICDALGCYYEMSSKTISVLHVNGLSAPVEGAAVDFSVTVAEPDYGTPTVKWNRVTNLKNNTSVALGTTATYAAGNMYNVSIYVPMNFNDIVSENMKIYLDGVEVNYYCTDAAFEGAVKSYEGDNTVYMGRHLKVNGQRYIIVSVMFPKLEGTHAHSYGADWVETPAKHYHLCSGCGDIKDAEYHYDNNKSGLCDVCGFDMKYYNKNASANSGTGTATGTHTHTYSTDWVEDISNHWKQCTGCGAKTSVAAHADLNNSGKCDLCGFVMTAAAGHTHTFATEWTETFAQHYKVCSCGAKNEIAAHVDLNNTGKCDTCGYAMTTLSNNGIVADTGDNNATFLWMAAFAVSALGAAATVLVARKKREE